MLRAMYTSITGLRNHQNMLDVVGNNIANVNTYGFKGSSVAFKTLLSQTMVGAGGPSATLGGTNAVQVGLGMTLDSITQQFTQGGIQSTGVGTDLAISGDGFFRTTNDPALLGAVGVSTAEMFYTRAGNFKWEGADALGNSRLVTSDGQFVVGYLDSDGATAGFQLGLPAARIEGVLQYNVNTQSDVLIGGDGQVTAFDSVAGARVTIGQISLSRFSNSSGLTAVGSNRWQESLNSGAPVDDVAQANGMGQLIGGALEMSNVDLATEFTEMIKAQRGFQANSRVITTSDEILQELVNLKR